MTYWKDTCPPIKGEAVDVPENSSVAIIGSGLAGVSVAYWMSQLSDIDDVQIIDCGTDGASFFRNAGHVLHGTGESYKAISSMFGRDTARDIMSISNTFCEDFEQTVNNLSIDCDYVKGNYYFLGKDKLEGQEVRAAVSMLNKDGFHDSLAMTKRFGEMNGFKNLDRVRWCKRSASAHPSKFRNAVLEAAKSKGVKHVSCPVKSIEEIGDRVRLEYQGGTSEHDFVILCTNAYTQLIDPQTRSKGLIEPYKGQIIVSKSLKKPMAQIGFSSDHGYMYGTITADNRILIGGWRNHVPGMETNTYDLTPNPLVEEGLKGWVNQHMAVEEEVEWEYSWAGIMGSSSNKGLPYIGQTNSQLIWMCAGFTGYGFSWAHGAARLLVNMMIGNEPYGNYKLFDPRQM